MKTYLDCYPCFFKQTLKTSRLITSDEKKIRQILAEVSITLPTLSLDATPPEIGKEVYRIISQMTGVDDPYKEIKDTCTRQALSLYPRMKTWIDSSKDGLMTAVRLSIAGNIIDFGAQADFNLEEDIHKILSQDFAINHYRDLCGDLAKAERILYVADNAGETVFDRLLIEEIGKPVIYAVRESAVINDATLEDAILSGVNEVAEIISSGCDAPGTILRLCSEEFLNIYRSADVVISKGQGNYEGLSGEKGPIYFLLKAKCPVIAQDIGIQDGSIVLMKANKANKARKGSR
ncbi:MAG: damage-control phosphatase ARMT1 family protein [Candidatus Aminicenantes bacterium]